VQKKSYTVKASSTRVKPYVQYVRYHRFTGQLKPIASFLDASGASGSSQWLRGALPR